MDIWQTFINWLHRAGLHVDPSTADAVGQAADQLGDVATKAGVEGAGLRIQAPLLHMSKADIVREGVRLGVDFAQTVSCYQADAEGRACGHCDACRLRAAGFATLLTALYGVLYLLLKSENNALLMGSLLLFGILAAIMWVTRKVDWYALGTELR